mgnify:CR=1 FL=1
MLKPNSKLVLDYVRAHDGEDMTAADIAEGTGLDVRVVNGVVTSAFQKKGYMVRTEAEIEIEKEDGSKGHKAVKFISLTDEGRTHDFDAEESKDAE